MNLADLRYFAHRWWSRRVGSRLSILTGALVSLGCAQTASWTLPAPAPELPGVGVSTNTALRRATKIGRPATPIAQSSHVQTIVHRASDAMPTHLPQIHKTAKSAISGAVEEQSQAPLVTITGVRSVKEKAESPTPHRLPINLWTVLQLAETNNGQLAIANERLYESQVVEELAQHAWIPSIQVGTGYYRHEGGIQRPNGSLIRASSGAIIAGLDVAARLDLRSVLLQRILAEQQSWQRRGEMVQLTSHALVDAAGTYFDLLAARNAEAVIVQMQELERFVLDRAKKLAEQEPQAKHLYDAARVQASARQQMLLQIRQKGDSAAIKLARLLGLPADVMLQPIDERLLPVELIDPAQSQQRLIERALAFGPGVSELEMILSVIQRGIDEAHSKRAYLPVLEARVLEGAFGAGPDSSMTFTNRFDFGVQARWDLTQLLTARSRDRLADSKLQQAHLVYRDHRNKLSLGVTEAQKTILHQQKQIRYGLDQIKLTKQLHDRSKLRLTELDQKLTNEVLQAIQAREMAQLNWLQSVRGHNQAQIRLFVLLGLRHQQESKEMNK